jgi:CBS domain-containing protein
MEIKKAGDIMISLDRYPHIPYWFTLRQAMAEMENAEFDINGNKCPCRVMLVFDEKYQLLGTVRRRDILRGLEPEFLSNLVMKERKHFFDSKTDQKAKDEIVDKLKTNILERAQRPVSDIMRIIKATVNYDDNLIRVIYEMVDNNISVIPVIKDNKVVGAVRSEDVFHEVAKLLLT